MNVSVFLFVFFRKDCIVSFVRQFEILAFGLLVIK